MDLASMIDAGPDDANDLTSALADLANKVSALRDLHDEETALLAQMRDMSLERHGLRDRLRSPTQAEENFVNLRATTIAEAQAGHRIQGDLERSETELRALTEPGMLRFTVAELTSEMMNSHSPDVSAAARYAAKAEDPGEHALETIDTILRPGRTRRHFYTLPRSDRPQILTYMALLAAHHGRIDQAVHEIHYDFRGRLARAHSTVESLRRSLERLQDAKAALYQEQDVDEIPAALRPLRAQLDDVTAELSDEETDAARAFLHSACPDIIDALGTVRTRIADSGYPEDAVTELGAANRLHNELITHVAALTRTKKIAARLHAVLEQQLTSSAPSVLFTRHLGMLVADAEAQENQLSTAVNGTVSELDAQITHLAATIRPSET